MPTSTALKVRSSSQSINRSANVRVAGSRKNGDQPDVRGCVTLRQRGSFAYSRERPLRARRHDDHSYGIGPCRHPFNTSCLFHWLTLAQRHLERSLMRRRDPEATTNFFRTELGKTLRVDEAADGAISVDILKDGEWLEAPRGMIGLRLSPSSR